MSAAYKDFKMGTYESKEEKALPKIEIKPEQKIEKGAVNVQVGDQDSVVTIVLVTLFGFGILAAIGFWYYKKKCSKPLPKEDQPSPIPNVYYTTGFGQMPQVMVQNELVPQILVGNELTGQHYFSPQMNPAVGPNFQFFQPR